MRELSGEFLKHQQTKFICKEKFNSNVVELNVFDWNEGAIRCYEKVGFQFNREKQKEIFVGNKKWISINMRIKIS